MPGGLCFEEFTGERPLRQLTLTDPLELAVLAAGSDRVTSAKAIRSAVRDRFPALTTETCALAIRRLVEAGLLYANPDLSRVVSLVILPSPQLPL